MSERPEWFDKLFKHCSKFQQLKQMLAHYQLIHRYTPEEVAWAKDANDLVEKIRHVWSERNYDRQRNVKYYKDLHDE